MPVRTLTLLLLSLSLAAAPLELVRNGRSAHSIVIAPGAPPAVQRAANELQHFLEQMSGARLPIATRPAARMVLVGPSPALDQLRLSTPQLGPEAFLLRTHGPHLVILGGGPRGSMYGVSTFLESLGCRWYTATLSRIPHRPSISVGPLDERHQPAFEYREPFYTEANDRDWAARNRMNGFHLNLDASTGGKLEYFPFVHSFYQLVDPKLHFAAHPEYFALIDGRRRDSHAQLCLTNPDALRIAIDSVERWIAEHPDATILSVSQNDGYGWCECDNCRRVEAEEGGAHSGPVLRFVNAVAEAIEKQHPEKLIDTLAYAYTEAPPTKVRPRSNVRIRLCRYSACEAHPLGQCPLNGYFLKNLQDWARLSRQLYVWHYNTNFSHYLAPFPDFDSLAADLPLYRDNGVVGLFMQGSRSRGGRSENAALRAWIIARLLWNPSVNVPALIREFHEAYFQESAAPMLEYFDLMQSQVRRGQHLWIYSRTDGPHLSDDFLAQAEPLLTRAASLAKSEDVRERVRDARRPIDYIRLMRAKTFSVADGQYRPAALDTLLARWTSFVAQLKADGITNLTEVENVDQTDALFRQSVRPYRALTLQNDRITIHVVPELDGRITHLIDRRTNRNLLRQGDPGSQTYPNVHGATLSAGWPITWSADPGFTATELRLTGRTSNGLTLHRRLWLDGATLHTSTDLENSTSAPVEAALESRWDFDLPPLDRMRLAFTAANGRAVLQPIFTPNHETAAKTILEGHETPHQQWRIQDDAGRVRFTNSFPGAPPARATLDWSFRSQDRVALQAASPRRLLAPGQRLTWNSDCTLP